MSNLTHLFKIGQKVRLRNIDEFTGKSSFTDGTVLETHENHIIVHDDTIGYNNWYENDLNIELVYPVYNW